MLILDAVDAKSIQSSVQKAHDAGVKVIAYDRLAQGPVDSYVSFDNKKVGQLQGEALVAAVGDKAGSGSIIMINGSPTDPNAADFKAGAHSAIDGKLKIGKEYDTPNWDPNNANQEASAAITAIGGPNVVGVYSANDGMAMRHRHRPQGEQASACRSPARTPSWTACSGSWRAPRRCRSTSRSSRRPTSRRRWR